MKIPCLFSVAILLLVSSSLHAQILNGGFEVWSGGSPVNWYSTAIEQTTRSQEGAFAITGATYEEIFNGMTIISSPVFTSYGGEDDIGFSVEARPLSLNGYFIYEPVEGDPGYLDISITATRRNANESRYIVGSGGQLIRNSASLDTSYTFFNIPIHYSNADEPDSIIISVSMGTSQAAGSRFYLDNLSLSEMEFTYPTEDELVISGRKDTLKWNTSVDTINLSYSLDDGDTYTQIVGNLDANLGEYEWEIPEELISAKAIIRMEDANDIDNYFIQPVRIKPWIITRLDQNDNYIAYDIDKDRWGFSNTTAGVWPQNWWIQFNYAGNDPFTGLPYPMFNTTFLNAQASDHVDWVSFVNTYGTNIAYLSLENAVYSPSALAHWSAIKSTWGGSCFGIAISNALAFQYRAAFLTYFSDFPAFTDPISITGDQNTYPVINELFAHQFGNPHQISWNINVNKTPTQTLQEMKEMFKDDNVRIRTLSFMNNNGSGGHAILAYKLRQDPEQDNIWFVGVYDNSFPNVTDAEIMIDTDANGGNGSWQPLYAWSNWGGSGSFALEDLAEKYFDTDQIPAKIAQRSSFILSDTLLRVYQNGIESLAITNNSGDSLGFNGETLKKEISGGYPIILKNGTERSPIGYNLPADKYQVNLSNFTDEEVSLSMFSGNKLYVLQRTGANINQTDLITYDGGLLFTNPDSESKTISLNSVINENINEKTFTIGDLSIEESDSVKFMNKDENSLSLVNHGNAKSYSLELNYYSSSSQSRFLNGSVNISANSTHLVTAEWQDTTSLPVQIFIDDNSDGTYDDTLTISNQLITSNTVEKTDDIPDDFRLEQNYPNPFNPSTVISYQVPDRQQVKLAVYNLLGQKVEQLVDQVQSAGSYTVDFDGSGLSSGIYFYQLQAGSIVLSKKMILLK